MIKQIYYCNLFIYEKYYLYLLLTLVIGSKSFEDLRTFDDHLYFYFFGAYMALGLLKNNGKWVSYFIETPLFLSEKTICILMVSIFTHGSIFDPSIL